MLTVLRTIGLINAPSWRVDFQKPSTFSLEASVLRQIFVL